MSTPAPLTRDELLAIEAKWRGFMVISRLLAHIRYLHYALLAAEARLERGEEQAPYTGHNEGV